MRKIALIVLISSLSLSFHATAEECTVTVSKIMSNKNGIVWFETLNSNNNLLKFWGDSEDLGINRSMSLALAAMAAGKNMIVITEDNTPCTGNIGKSWNYVVAIP
jgi:hypothetical protein